MNTSKQQSGFTLIELMIVVVILAVTLGLVFPAFESSQVSAKLRSYSNHMVSAAASARSESIKRNADLTLCASSDGATCATSGSWDQGWVVLDPNDAVLHQHPAIKDGFKLTAKELGGSTDVTAMTFASNGGVTPAAHFELCRQSPEVGFQEREVKIYATGRAKVVRTYNGACP